MARRRTIAAVGALLAVAATAYIVDGNPRRADDLREVLRLVATVTSVPTFCPDDRKPFYVTIRNLAGRTVTAASFQFPQDPLPAGTLPSDIPVLSLTSPLRPGQDVSGCHVLNRLQLFARGIDPRSVIFAPMVMPDSVVFQP